MQNISNLLKNKKITRDYRNSYEYQAYGNNLAQQLNDIKHRALYIKMSKNEDRNILENARVFVISQKHITDKGKLFMWKVKKIKQEKKSLKKIKFIEQSTIVE